MPHVRVWLELCGLIDECLVFQLNNLNPISVISETKIVEFASRNLQLTEYKTFNLSLIIIHGERHFILNNYSECK